MHPQQRLIESGSWIILHVMTWLGEGGVKNHVLYLITERLAEWPASSLETNKSRRENIFLISFLFPHFAGATQPVVVGAGRQQRTGGGGGGEKPTWPLTSCDSMWRYLTHSQEVGWRENDILFVKHQSGLLCTALALRTIKLTKLNLK